MRTQNLIKQDEITMLIKMIVNNVILAGSSLAMIANKGPHNIEENIYYSHNPSKMIEVINNLPYIHIDKELYQGTNKVIIDRLKTIPIKESFSEFLEEYMFRGTFEDGKIRYGLRPIEARSWKDNFNGVTEAFIDSKRQNFNLLASYFWRIYTQWTLKAAFIIFGHAKACGCRLTKI
jgi:predicted CopG family antitoxin